MVEKMQKEVEQNWLLESFTEELSTTKALMLQVGPSLPNISERFERFKKDLHTVTTAFTMIKSWKKKTISKMEELVQIAHLSTVDGAKAADAIHSIEGEVEQIVRSLHSVLELEPKTLTALGQNRADNKTVKNTLDILMARESLNQNEKLKSCFCSLSIFPDSSMIKRRKLIYWWIGMGIVEPQLGKGADEIGEEYFQKLLSIGLVQPYKKNAGAEIHGCTMSPSMHSLAVSIAREAGLFGFELQGTPSCTSFSAGTIYLTPVEKHKVVNISVPPSTFLFNINADFLNLGKLAAATLEMQKLTVLQLGKWQSCSSEEDRNIKILDTVSLSTCLEHLKKLRYLGLHGVLGIKELPDTIKGLVDLQVLDIRACDELQRLTRPRKGSDHSKLETLSLKKLTHLDVSECYLLNYLPSEILDLPEVQVLKGFMMGYTADIGTGDLISNLGKWKKLKKLGIDFGSVVEIRDVDVSAIRNLVSLCTLTISWTNYIRRDAGEATLKLDWLPESLKKLDLRRFPLEELPPDGLVSGKLKNLGKLYFRGGELQNLQHIAKDGALLQLMTLRLRYLKHFDRLTLSFLKETFPSLLNLDVSNCPLSAQQFFDVSFHGRLALLVYFLVYPEGCISKKSDFAYWLISNGSPSYSSAEELVASVFAGLSVNGQIRLIDRKGSSIVQGCVLTLQPAYIRPMAVKLGQELGYLGYDSAGTPAEKNQVATLCVSSTIKFEPLSLYNLNMQYLQLDQIVTKMKNLSHVQLGRWPGYTGGELRIASASTFFNSLLPLRNLRYLGLRGVNGITELPASVGGLLYLRVLDLRGCTDLATMHPNGVATLKNLIHLDVWQCNSLQRMPSDFQMLTSTLEVMHGLVVLDQHVQLSHFNDKSLRKLSLVFRHRIEFGKQTLHFWNKKLRVLSISWRPEGNALFPANCPSLTLGWFLAPLGKLELCGYPMEETPPGLLPKRFPYLKRLYFEGGFLRSLQGLAKKTATKEEAEWHVEVLRLRGLQDLEVDWFYLRQCFPSLKYAEIVDCPKVTSFPGNRDGRWIKESDIESSSSAPPVPEAGK